jgi:hypothetical protein
MALLPFTPEQFLAVFVAYNDAVWPAQLVAYAAGLGMAFAIWRPSPWTARIVSLGLAAMWLWTGVAYHWGFFAEINQAALGFGAMFALQGGLFSDLAFQTKGLRFERTGESPRGLAWALVFYAAVLYPLIGLWTGHRYPALPMFGIAPCPVVLFTLGVLLLAQAPLPRRLVVVPFLWALIGGTAAFLLGVAQDWLLLASAGVAVYLFVRDRRPLRPAAT